MSEDKKGVFMLIFDPKQQDEMNEIIWTKSSAILGRKSKTNQENNFLNIGESKCISREHAKIVWNIKTRHWELKVLSGKGVRTDSGFYDKDETIKLSNNKPTPLKLGTTRLYFCPAQAEPITKSINS
eukprot:546213_1